MADWISAIGAGLSSVAAIVSLLAFLVALKMQKDDSINDVRPELLLEDWSIEDGQYPNTGPHTNILAARLRNVGRGPAFNISYMSSGPKEATRYSSSLMICPYLPADGTEPAEVRLVVFWDKLPRRDRGLLGREVVLFRPRAASPCRRDGDRDFAVREFHAPRRQGADAEALHDAQEHADRRRPGEDMVAEQAAQLQRAWHYATVKRWD